LERISAAHAAAGKKSPVTIGLAFDEQILDDYTIPMEAHDKVLDYVVTPTRIFAGMK
jgi:5-formyltetrahydrofolate cyclo-ligase